MSVPLQTTAGVCKAHLQSCSFGLSRRLFGKPNGRAYSTAASQTYKCLQQTAYLKSAFFAPLPTLRGHASGQQRNLRCVSSCSDVLRGHQKAKGISQPEACCCRTSVVSMALKTGIVGMPNVGKVSQRVDSVLPSVSARPILQTLLHRLLHVVCTPGVASQLVSRSDACNSTELKSVIMCPVLAVHIVQCYMQERQSSSSKLPILHH